VRAFILALAVAGCTRIDYSTPPPEGFPKLTPIYAAVSDEEFRKLCPVGSIACSWVYFDRGECMIYHKKDPGTLPRWVRNHEEAHCRGYGHVGEPFEAMQAFREWKARADQPARVP
jgi:hypothetical protein